MVCYQVILQPIVAKLFGGSAKKDTSGKPKFVIEIMAVDVLFAQVKKFCLVITICKQKNQFWQKIGIMCKCQ